MSLQQCSCCGVSEGEHHKLICTNEECPICGNQFSSCGCKYVLLGFDYSADHSTCGLPEEIYMDGLNQEHIDRLAVELRSYRRFPHIAYPLLCGMCGKLFPEFFRVSNAEWRFYISKRHRHKIFCKECYLSIKEKTNTHSGGVLLSPWRRDVRYGSIACSRAVAGDIPLDEIDRLVATYAFVSKTYGIRLRPFAMRPGAYHAITTYDISHNFEQGSTLKTLEQKKEWCDSRLRELGYTLL